MQVSGDKITTGWEMRQQSGCVWKWGAVLPCVVSTFKGRMWYCVSGEMITWVLEPEGKSRKVPSLHHSHWPNGALCVSCPWSSQPCGITSAAPWRQHTFARGQERIQLNYKLQLLPWHPRQEKRASPLWPSYWEEIRKLLLTQWGRGKRCVTQVTYFHQKRCKKAAWVLAPLGPGLLFLCQGSQQPNRDGSERVLGYLA